MTNEQLDALLPCPFCGGVARRRTLGPDEFGNEGGDVIECSTCEASSHVEFGYKENLVSSWNRRTDTALRARAEAAEADAGVLRELDSHMFAVQHNPNCPSPWLVRMPGKSASIDMKPYATFDPDVPLTEDILGFGKTFKEAASRALAAHNERKGKQDAGQ